MEKLSLQIMTQEASRQTPISIHRKSKRITEFKYTSSSVLRKGNTFLSVIKWDRY